MIFIFSYNLIKLLLKTQQELSTYKRVLISALQGVVKRHSAAPLPSVPSNNEKKGYGLIQLRKTESLFDLIGKIDPIQVVESENPSSMESVGQVFKKFSLVGFQISLFMLVEFKISEPFFSNLYVSLFRCLDFSYIHQNILHRSEEAICSYQM